MTSIELKAPAKVNIFLKVLGRRSDSYHNILTLFNRISLADTIKISKIPSGIKLVSDTRITPDPKDNLAYKAARLLMERRRITGGVKIKIKKKIPIAAGLGGGSSDAASVLMGMNRLFNLKVSPDKLMDIGAKLGADVPFFILDTPFAVGTGKGEVLKKTPLKARPWHLIVNPGFGVSTKEVYRSWDFALTTKKGDVKIQFPLETSLDITALEYMCYNDLERVVRQKNRAIGRIIERLVSSLGKRAIVSGSGPSVFCLYKTGKEAMGARSKFLRGLSAVEKAKWQVFVAATA